MKGGETRERFDAYAQTVKAAAVCFTRNTRYDAPRLVRRALARSLSYVLLAMAYAVVNRVDASPLSQPTASRVRHDAPGQEQA
jgi:hypothetical protein